MKGDPLADGADFARAAAGNAGFARAATGNAGLCEVGVAAVGMVVASLSLAACAAWGPLPSSRCRDLADGTGDARLGDDGADSEAGAARLSACAATSLVFDAA